MFMAEIGIGTPSSITNHLIKIRVSTLSIWKRLNL